MATSRHDRGSIRMIRVRGGGDSAGTSKGRRLLALPSRWRNMNTAVATETIAGPPLPLRMAKLTKSAQTIRWRLSRGWRTRRPESSSHQPASQSRSRCCGWRRAVPDGRTDGRICSFIYLLRCSNNRTTEQPNQPFSPWNNHGMAHMGRHVLRTW